MARLIDKFTSRDNLPMPRWLLGFAALVTLIMGTGLCALTTFSLTQQAVLDLHRTGMPVEDPWQALRCVITGQWPCDLGNGSLAAPGGESPLLVLTPMLTPQAIEPARANQPAAVVTSAFAAAGRSTAAPLPSPTPVAQPLAELPRITDPRQIRILLMGIDQRSATGERGPFRSDTMMLMNIDPVRKTVGVLALPRDLWVTIPGYEPGRINTANFIGDRDAYPGGGGPALAMATVSENFGVPVNKYLLINFDVFLTLVDLLAPEGVPITVTEHIDDPSYPDAGYGFLHVTFEPGPQRLDAERLLQYARTRKTEGGDFDRLRRQQQVLDALRAEVLSAGGVLNIIAQAPRLWQALHDNYRTNLTLEDVLALARLMTEIGQDDIRFEVIDNLYVSTGLSPSGEQVLYPNYAAIGDLIQRVFYPQLDVSNSELQARAQAENAPIFVFNGTQRRGLASQTSEWLSARGINVAGVKNLNGAGLQMTEIRDYGGRYSWTARHLAQLLGLADSRIVRAGDGAIAEGVMVALGEDAPGIIGG